MYKRIQLTFLKKRKAAKFINIPLQVYLPLSVSLPISAMGILFLIPRWTVGRPLKSLHACSLFACRDSLYGVGYYLEDDEA